VAEPAKPLVQFVAELPTHGWVPLIEALARARAAVGSDELAVYKLTQHHRAGRLTAGARRLLGLAETCVVFERAFWQQAEIDRPAPGSKQPRVRGAWDFLWQGSWYFFVRRVELDEQYPVPGVPAPSEPRKRKRRTRDQEVIWQLATELWPDGWDHLEPKDIVKRISDEVERRGLLPEPPKRDKILRALGFRKG
jgi:hypothetical protein